VERNRISSLQSHGKTLEKESCLPGIFCDSGDTPDIIILTPVLNFQGMKKITLCNTKKYKNQAGMNLAPPPPRHYYYYNYCLLLRSSSPLRSS